MVAPILICSDYGCCIIESVHEPVTGVHSSCSKAHTSPHSKETRTQQRQRDT